VTQYTEVVKTFPSAKIAAGAGRPDIEVSLICQLGHGAGNHLFASVASRQRQHSAFIDELEEPSARIGSTNFQKGDATALYSFVVGPKGHPFHRHAGHRIFTAVSGSGGAQLRFSTATNDDIEKDPQNFVRHMQFINIPPDCLFTVRFGGETWHQFYPLSRHALHPVFFALSCHTNELGGNLAEDLKRKVLNDEADIPSLTELPPAPVMAILGNSRTWLPGVPVTALSLDAPEGTMHRAVCNTFRSGAGMLRGLYAAWKDASGYTSRQLPQRPVTLAHAPSPASLLQGHLAGLKCHHEDEFILMAEGNFENTTADSLLAAVLEGFLLNPPSGVSGLMALRNALVRPLGLRTSPLGCPVSSLLSSHTSNLFADQYPVLDQRVSDDRKVAEVILGANDKHLSFRSCVGVEILDATRARISLGDRVHCKNLFGRFYMSAINAVHETYIGPTILRRATDFALGTGP